MKNIENSTWYVLVSQQKYGPYSYHSMIEMQQANQLMDFNYVWSAHLAAWTPLHQLEEFSKDRFRLLLQNEGPLQEAFIARRHPRREVNIPLVGHNSIRFFDGQVISISQKGALCLFNSPLVQLGDRIKMCLVGSDKPEENFSLSAEVVRKNFSKERINSKSGLHYAIIFDEVHPTGIKQIELWTKAA